MCTVPQIHYFQFFSFFFVPCSRESVAQSTCQYLGNATRPSGWSATAEGSDGLARWSTRGTPQRNQTVVSVSVPHGAPIRDAIRSGSTASGTTERVYPKNFGGIYAVWTVSVASLLISKSWKLGTMNSGFYSGQIRVYCRVKTRATVSMFLTWLVATGLAVSLAVCMREGEKRKALQQQKISGRIRQTADIRYDIVSNGWFAVASWRRRRNM